MSYLRPESCAALHTRPYGEPYGEPMSPRSKMYANNSMSGGPSKKKKGGMGRHGGVVVSADSPTARKFWFNPWILPANEWVSSGYNDLPSKIQQHKD